MSKNKRKKQKVKESLNLSAETIEQQAKKDMVEQKYRRALDGFKNLRKEKREDKEYLLREIVECYRGLADQMVKKGLFEEAKMVLVNIKALTGEDSGKDPDIAMAIQRKDFTGAAEIIADLLAQRAELSHTAKCVAGDMLVLAFKDFQDIELSRPDIYKELKSVQLALKEICEERFAEALEEVRQIGRKSLFSNWKLFIKGLVAFYSGQDQKAVRAFKSLSAGSQVQSACGPFLLLLETEIPKNKKPGETLLKNTCEIAGHPELAAVLPRADYLWNSGRHRDSYRLVREKLSPFPTEKSGIPEILSQFYFNNILHLSGKPGLKYLNEMIRLHVSSPPSQEKNLEAVFLRRVECLFLEKIFVEGNIRIKHWEIFLKCHKKMSPENKKLQALVYFHLGSFFAIEEEIESYRYFMMPSLRRKTKIRDAKLAEKFIKKSTDLDTGNKDTWLALLRVYEKCRENSKANNLLDKLIKLFPEDKTIIAKAGQECVDRKSYVKGVKYLEQAVELNRLDNAVKDHLALAYIKTAVNYYDKGKVSQGREIFEKALKNTNNHSHDFNRGSVYLYALRSILELKAGNREPALEKADMSGERAISPFFLQYFSLFASRAYGAPESYIKIIVREVAQGFKNAIDPHNAVFFIKVLDHFNPFEKQRWYKNEKIKLIQFTRKAAKKPCSREDAQFIVNFSLEKERNNSLARLYIQKILKENARDPLFLYLNFISKQKKNAYIPKKSHIQELKEILNLARERNETKLIPALQKLIKEKEEEWEGFDRFDGPSMLDALFDDEEEELCDCPKCRKLRDEDYDEDYEEEEKEEELIPVQGDLFNGFPVSRPRKKRKKRR